ncbi:MAG: hypothetical protein CME06_07100 [Gemmatimonadetes bacterium]|nr:hypothetical protein [Gemmatimonadota bacterium]
MIHDAAGLKLPLALSADLCVIGSGAGGGMVAAIAVQAGLDVILLESGSFIPPEQMTQREERMIPRLLWDAGARTNRDRSVQIHQGRGVGGSTLHNFNLCKRIPTPILEEWRRERGMRYLGPDRWESLYANVEKRLRVELIPPEWRNVHNSLLEAGCRELGWSGGWLRHNRSGCNGSGYCELGCAYDAKNNVPKILLPDAIDAGLTVLTHCQAIRIEHRDGRAKGVEAVAVHPVSGDVLGPLRIEAGAVCVSASATGTAALLWRSEVPDRSGTTGESLRIHPALVVAGEFSETVRAWRGVPQSYECTELLDFEAAHRTGGGDAPPGTRTWIVPAFAHPMATATMIPGHGAEHRRIMKRYDNLAVLTAMIHDHSTGRVRPRGDLGLRIDYHADSTDRKELVLGLLACIRLLRASGAIRVFVPTDPPLVLEPNDSPPALEALELDRSGLRLAAVHPMGSVPMGDDPASAAIDSRGKHHHLDRLWVADGSLFPSSIGVPPQLSIYALGLHVGRAIVDSPA